MKRDGYTLVEMALVLVVMSFLLLLAIPSVRSMERLALIDFTEALVHDIAEVGQYPYVATDEKCVPRLRWYIKERRYQITCGTTSITSGVVPDGVEMSLPTSNEIIFSKSAATYAGQWKFSTDQVSVTLKFRMGTHEPEVIHSEAE